MVRREMGLVLPPKANLKPNLPGRGPSPPHTRGSGGSRDRWGRNVIQAQPGCAETDAEQCVGWGGPGADTLQAFSQVTTSWLLQLPFLSSSWLVSLKDSMVSCKDFCAYRIRNVWVESISFGCEGTLHHASFSRPNVLAEHLLREGGQWLGVRTQNPDEAQPAMSFQLLTFLGIRSQDLSKCSSSRLWGKHNPSNQGAHLALPILH